jgi:hypothetical protein
MVILRLRFFIRREAEKLVIFQQLRFGMRLPGHISPRRLLVADDEKAYN